MTPLEKVITPLEKAIEEKIGEVRTDAFDISFGELISLYKDKEFVISPDFQRFFRWTVEQSSRLIESIVLELPIPQVFMIETGGSVLELVDGLQRISSVIQFVQPELISRDALTLEGCDLVPALNGHTFETLPLPLRFRIKRAKLRAVVIKRQSTAILRYEMFKRLNTGGSEPSVQEIRNCTSRMAGPRGIEFYEFIRSCAGVESFKTCTSTLADADREQKADEELVLRFFALKNASDLFRGSVRDWLDRFMEQVILEKRPFDQTAEMSDFVRLFGYLARVMGEGAFVRYRGVASIGGLAPAHFEAVTIGTWRVLSEVETGVDDQIRQKIIETVQSPEFRAFVGPGSNSLAKFNGRIKTIETALRGIPA